MANLQLYTHSFDTQPYSYPCYELNFEDVLSHPSSSYANLVLGSYPHNIGTGDNAYYGFSFSCKPEWNVTDPETGDVIHHNILENDLVAPFLPFPAWKQTTAEDGYMDWDNSLEQVQITTTTLEPDDWQDNFLSYYTRVKGNGQSSYTYFPNNVSSWINFRDATLQDGRTMWRSKIKTGIEFLVRGGLFPMSFRIRNYIGSCTYNTASSHANACISGMSPANFNSSMWYWNANTHNNSNSFVNMSTSGYVLDGATFGWSGERSLNIRNPGSLRAQTYPISFSVSAGTTIGSLHFTEKTSFYGIMTVTFSDMGIATAIYCSVLSKNMWEVKQGTSGNNAGADSISSGGHGKQKAGTDNPHQGITRNTSGGLLTDPTASPGFVIYKFTPAEFTDFLNRVYTETALPEVAATITAPLSHFLMEPTSLLLKFLSNAAGWSDTENIVFVKTSPVSFPSHSVTLSKLSIGSLGIGDQYSPITAAVVDSYLVPVSYENISFGSEPQWFTDVEPYASASLYLPLAGSISIPPSVLDEAHADIYGAFNLLNNGCGYSIHLYKGNSARSFLHLAKNGECAKAADCVIPGRNVSNTVGSVGALTATGIATLATGGTATPALITTAFGAATTAVHDAVDMSITNMPPNSSGSPYDDTVNGGLRSIFLYRPKATRFTSGEVGDNNERSKVMGTFSYKYIETISLLSDDSYFSVMDIALNMQAGMTKEEHDEIVALLKEGAWI